MTNLSAERANKTGTGIAGDVLAAIRRFFNATFNIYNYALLAILFIVTAYPFWYILISSFSDYNLIHGFALIPAGFTFELYKVVFESGDILHAFVVSVIRSVSGPVLSVLVSMLAASALARKVLPGHRFFSLYFIITMYFGAGLIPFYILMKSLSLTGSFFIYILPGIMGVFSMLIMKTYIETIPVELEESAHLDGANDLMIFFRILLPLSIPVIAAMALFGCVGHWNSYTDTLFFNSNKPELYTLQYLLVTFINSVSSTRSQEALARYGVTGMTTSAVTPMGVRMAITVIAIVPVSLVYPFLQKYFIKGLLIGSIKA